MMEATSRHSQFGTDLCESVPHALLSASPSFAPLRASSLPHPTPSHPILGWVVGPRRLGSVLAGSADSKVGQAVVEFSRMLGMSPRDSVHPCITTLEVRMLIWA